jgi:hypothetical protein
MFYRSWWFESNERIPEPRSYLMTSFPRGSEWRKWDLHIHIPGTKLSNQFEDLEG